MAAALFQIQRTAAEHVVGDRGREHAGKALPWSLAAALFTIYAALAIRDQQRMVTTGYDLGIFDQAVRAYAHGHLPISTLKGPHYDLLGDHFSPIIATLAPCYLLWPSAYTLLIAQAALFAVGVVPLSRWATAELGARAAAAIGVIYGLSWGIAAAAGFDFHEVAFGVPLLAFSATALGRRRPHAAVLWALPLLLVKEDLGFTVAVIGLLAATRGAKIAGLAAAAVGVAGSIIEVKVLIPAVNPAGYAYTTSLFTGGPPHAGTAAHLLYDAAHFLLPHVKIITLIQLLAPTAFLATRSPLILLTVPTLTWRFLSDDSMYWGTMFQYSAVLMPIVAAAFIEALTRRRDRQRSQAHPPRPTRSTWPTPLAPLTRLTRPTRLSHLSHLYRTSIFPPLVIGLIVTAILLPSYPLAKLAHPGEWTTPPRIAAARTLLQKIPDGATVSASNTLIPQLTDRATVYLFKPTTLDSVTWIIIDTQSINTFPLSQAADAQLITTAEHTGFQVVANQDGYLLLHRSQLTQTIAPSTRHPQ
jgi:uncharacterized membrane protein